MNAGEYARIYYKNNKHINNTSDDDNNDNSNKIIGIIIMIQCGIQVVGMEKKSR